MLTAEQRFDLIAPQYSGNASKSSYLEIAEERTARVSCGGWTVTSRPQAVALRAAHMMTLALDPTLTSGSEAGPVTQKREGDVWVTYSSGAVSASDGDLGLTKYGRQLLTLAKETFVMMGVC